MAAKWQQWMPLYINRLRGSVAVQSMHPTARAGFLWLLLDEWETEDCTIPCSSIELAARSGLGEKLWKQFGPVILAKFVPVTVTVNGTQVERLRNLVGFDLWLEAKRIFEKRREAADRTNSKRGPKRSPQDSEDGHRNGERHTVTETLTGTETGTGGDERDALAPEAPPPDAPISFDADPVENIPDGLSVIQYALFVCKQLRQATTNRKTFEAAIEAIEREEGVTQGEATKRLILRAKSDPPHDGNWWKWVSNGCWKQSKTFTMGIPDEA